MTLDEPGHNPLCAVPPVVAQLLTVRHAEPGPRDLQLASLPGRQHSHSPSRSLQRPSTRVLLEPHVDAHSLPANVSPAHASEVGGGAPFATQHLMAALPGHLSESMVVSTCPSHSPAVLQMPPSAVHWLVSPARQQTLDALPEQRKRTTVSSLAVHADASPHWCDDCCPAQVSPRVPRARRAAAASNCAEKCMLRFDIAVRPLLTRGSNSEGVLFYTRARHAARSLVLGAPGGGRHGAGALALGRGRHW